MLVRIALFMRNTYRVQVVQGAVSPHAFPFQRAASPRIELISRELHESIPQGIAFRSRISRCENHTGRAAPGGDIVPEKYYGDILQCEQRWVSLCTNIAFAHVAKWRLEEPFLHRVVRGKTTSVG